MLAMWLLTFGQLYHQEIGELAAVAYRESLREFSAEQIERGCKQAVRECEFIPKPADIIRCIEETSEINRYPLLVSPPNTVLTDAEKKELSEQMQRVADKLGIRPA